VCRAALKDVTNLPNSCKEKISQQKLNKIEDECKEIASPSAFGLFDLGVNQDFNQHAMLQLSANVKVSSDIGLLCLVVFFACFYAAYVLMFFRIC
jgi:hypothetical protein